MNGSGAQGRVLLDMFAARIVLSDKNAACAGRRGVLTAGAFRKS
jgi:hypothetical protein